MADTKIKVNVDPDLEELIPGFLENRARDVIALREALGGGDIARIQSIGHSLKGVGGGYGFTGLSELGAEMEKEARAGNSGALPALVDRIADYLQRVEIHYN